jgi:hypothetical protein
LRISNAVVPLPDGFHSAPRATECRSTLLVASLSSLARRGHRPAYERNIEPRDLMTIASAVAGVWLPMELALAHYRACDALDLSVQERLDLGAEVVTRTTSTLMGTVLVAAKSAGVVTVWSMLARYGHVYARNFHGGGATVTQTGPKDARIDVMGLPLASVPYFRIAYLGSLRAAVEFFATRAVVTEIQDACTATTLGFRALWV